MSLTPPDNGLAPQNQKWRTWVETTLLAFSQRLEKFKNDTTNSFLESRSSMKLLSSQISYLQELGTSDYAEFVTGIQATANGYIDPHVRTQVSTPSGKIEITFGGSLNSGVGIFVYEVANSLGNILISKESVLANFAKRVSVTGGASFSPSASNSVQVEVPANETLTVDLWLQASTATGVVTTFFIGGSILVRPSI